MKKCAFCPQDAVEHGGEHIWDNWQNESFPVIKGRIRYTHTSGKSREYDTYKADEKLPVVCHDCNTRWMSQITKMVKVGFESAIVHGSPLCILPSGIVLLAAFTFMKAAVAASDLAQDDEAFFTRAQRESLRTSLAVPEVGVRMWIGTFKGQALYSRRFVPAILSSEAPQLRGVEYFTFTYLTGHLLLQLLAGRFKYVHNRGRGLLPMLRPDAYWDQACIQFWPPTNISGITWPPPKYFEDQGLKDFINRFKLPVTVPTGFRPI
jgi:hypothetical protein